MTIEVRKDRIPALINTVRELQAAVMTLSSDLARNYVSRDELRDQIAELKFRSQLLDSKLDRVLMIIGGVHGNH